MMFVKLVTILLVAVYGDKKADTATLTVKNTAASGVTLMDSSCQAGTAHAMASGSDLALPLGLGAHKFWVVPDGCTEAEGCYKCGLDCLGCFYISPIVSAQGVMVTGIGYGHNTPVKVHEGVSGAKLTAVNQMGQDDHVECTTESCDVNHIIQARSDMVFTIEGSDIAAKQEQIAIVNVKNNAASSVTLMSSLCERVTAMAPGSDFDLLLGEGAHKIWVVPDGCTEAEGCYKCGLESLDCLGCFYISTNVSCAQGVVVTGIGYGHDTPVKVHEGVSGAKLTAVNQMGQDDHVECTTESCDVNHIIQSHTNKFGMVFTIEGSNIAPKQEQTATLTVKNTAASGVTLMDSSCQAGTAHAMASGSDLALSLGLGAHKFWVVPDGCTEAEGCYKCGLDCLGCFYISPIVSAQGVMVTGIGYGHNTPVKVHEGVSGAKLTAVNQMGQDDHVECTTESCDVNHIIQAHSDMVFTIEGQQSIIV